VISSVRGPVLRLSGTTAIIDVGGVGFSVQLTASHALALRVGHEAAVVTSLIVREDSLQLFGFPDYESLEIFTLLCGVTGVGPKSAIGVLSELSATEIAQAVTRENDAVFRKVSGIGPKTAKLIVLSLTGKVLPVSATATSASAVSVSDNVRSDVLTALVGLGWNERVAESGLDSVLETASVDDAESVQALLRLALTQLGPRNAGAGR
jgi:Holliday junction DNA helicase RuvA